MKKIIALRGAGGTGKTSTIRLLHNILLANGYERIYSTFEIKKDFLAVFSKGGKRIGVSSSGDTYDIVKENLDYLISQDCSYCICACHTTDRKRGGIKRGTNTAIDSFIDYDKEYVDKVYEEDEQKQAEVNQNDAERLLRKLDSLCLMPLV